MAKRTNSLEDQNSENQIIHTSLLAEKDNVK